VWDSSELDPRYLQALTHRWPGWQVRGHADGLALHVAITGRDPFPFMVPEAQAIDEMIDELTQDSSIDPARLQKALTSEGGQQLRQALSSAGEPVTFGKGFFSSDKPPLSGEERRALIRRLFYDWSDMPDTPADE
jgi:hypothetical protein